MIEERTVPGGEYRSVVASAYQVSAVGGSNIMLKDGGGLRADSQLSNSSVTSMQSFGSAFSDPVKSQNEIEVHKTPLSIAAPQVERGVPKRRNCEIISPNDSAPNTTQPPLLRGKAKINERQIAPRRLSFQD